MRRKPTPELLQTVLTIPPRRHWPDQTRPFSIYDSEVVRQLIRDECVLTWLFDTLRGRKLIVYDHYSGTWRGRNWRPKR